MTAIVHVTDPAPTVEGLLVVGADAVVDGRVLEHGETVSVDGEVWQVVGVHGVNVGRYYTLSPEVGPLYDA